MLALISNCETEFSYFVSSESQCKDSVDKSAYQAFKTIGETISMGKVIVSYPDKMQRDNLKRIFNIAPTVPLGKSTAQLFLGIAQYELDVSHNNPIALDVRVTGYFEEEDSRWVAFGNRGGELYVEEF